MSKKAIGLAVVGAAALCMVAFATPFLTLWRVAAAVEARDADQLELVVDFPAVREGLRNQLNARAMQGAHGAEGAVAALFAPELVNSVIDSVVTPHGVIGLMATGEVLSDDAAAAPSQAGDRPKFKLHRARFLSLNRFKATMGPDATSTVELVLDRSGLFGWKIARVNLLDPAPAVSAPSEQADVGGPDHATQYPAVSELDADGRPSAGAPYGVWRAYLVSNGVTPDPDWAGDGGRELSCRSKELCVAIFRYTDKDGWGRYLVVETDGAGQKVLDVRDPVTVEGLTPIPPPPASDIPNLVAQPYGAARKRLIAEGYLPTRAYQAEPTRACAKAIETGDFVDCEDDLDLPEVANCSPTGRGYCVAYWLGGNGRVLKVTTIGEPQPGGVYNMEWASKQDLSELPQGWRP